MRLGFLTACLPGTPLEEIAGWAGQQGYQALEVACWPSRRGRDWEASHIDVERFTITDVEPTRALFAKNGLEISALAYYENNLHADPEVRDEIYRHLIGVIDAAQALGVGLVGTFVGRDVTKTVRENMRLAERIIPPIVEYAAARDVRLIIENCPMEGWHPDGYPANLAYSPELWTWLATLGLYLNYDPSHLVWLGIDPVSALEGHLDRVLHVQAKDTEVDVAARNQFGVFGQVDKPTPWTSGWWRYRVPGLGDVDWRRLVDRLYEGGFDGVVSVEHEDPVWSGTPDRVKQGLVIAQRTLADLIVD